MCLLWGELNIQMRVILRFILSNFYSQSKETQLFRAKHQQKVTMRRYTILEAWNVAYFSGQPVGSILKDRVVFLDCFTLKTGSICYPETSVTKYQPMPLNVIEEPKPRLHHGRSALLCMRFSVAGANEKLKAGGNASEVP